jgi:hypothetical protein
VPLQNLGVPTATTNYALCIYAANSLIEEPEIAAHPTLWEADGTEGYKYKDPTAMPDGIRKVRLSVDSKVRVQGKGVNLPDPVLDLALPVTVQLVNSSDVCFEGVYVAPIYNNPARFKATGKATGP